MNPRKTHQRHFVRMWNFTDNMHTCDPRVRGGLVHGSYVPGLVGGGSTRDDKCQREVTERPNQR